MTISDNSSESQPATKDAANGGLPAATITFPRSESGDPLIDVIARLDACVVFFNASDMSDEDSDVFARKYEWPLWKAFGQTDPTTPEGAVKGLRYAFNALRDDGPGDPLDRGLVDASTYRAIENVLGYFEGMVSDAKITQHEQRRARANDPLVALWARWCNIEYGPEYIEGTTKGSEEDFNDRKTGQADAVAVKIISAPPETLAGARVQIALLALWAKDSAPFQAKAALTRLYKRLGAKIDPNLPLTDSHGRV